MNKTCLPPLIATLLSLTLACGGGAPSEPEPEPEPGPGDEVTIEMPDGSLVTGRVRAGSEVQPASDVERLEPSTRAPAVDSTLGATPAFAPVVSEPVALAPVFSEVAVPAGTMLHLTLESALASDVSRVEDPVRARLTRPVMVDGVAAIPEGSVVHGTVTTADPSGKVRGRARLAFRFDRVDIDIDQYVLRSSTVSLEARATKADDAKKIGIGAGAGAVIGGLLGGGKGAGTGAALGGGAGTAMVLSTTGNEVALGSGSPVEVSLEEGLVVLVPQE